MRWARRGRRRGPFMRQLGCLFVVFAGMALSVVLGMAWLVGAAFGALETGIGLPQAPLGIVAVVALVILVVLVLAMVYFARSLRRLALPLDELVSAAGRVESGDYTVRIPEARRGPREVLGLVRAFNTMTERLGTDEGRRQALLADVSHELRTPLAVIKGEIEAIQDGVRPADNKELGAILDEVAVMSRLVDDLRTLALSESGTLALHPEPVDLGILAAEAAAAFRTGAEAADVTLEVDTQDDLPLLEADPVRIREVVGNLIANALDHTQAGDHIRIETALEDTSVRISVADTGAGIDPELLPRIFERFAKGVDSRGSGLGLAIARYLVEAHGGTIVAESDPGNGTTFTIRIPVIDSDAA